MALQAIIFLLLGLVILILLVLIAILLWRFYDTNRKLAKLLEKGKIKDFKDIVLAQKERIKDMEVLVKEAFLKIESLETVCKKTVQKIGVVRFNPFNDIGGNQSFVIALLDEMNSGFLISSLFVSGGSRVYAKSIKQGKSNHALSKEEVEALGQAINSSK